MEASEEGEGRGKGKRGVRERGRIALALLLNIKAVHKKIERGKAKERGGKGEEMHTHLRERSRSTVVSLGSV